MHQKVSDYTCRNWKNIRLYCIGGRRPLWMSIKRIRNCFMIFKGHFEDGTSNKSIHWFYWCDILQDRTVKIDRLENCWNVEKIVWSPSNLSLKCLRLIFCWHFTHKIYLTLQCNIAINNCILLKKKIIIIIIFLGNKEK